MISRSGKIKCKRIIWLPLLTAIITGCSAIVSAQNDSSNDHIFPAAALAKPFIDFDSKGFFVHGKRTFIVSAGMEYARVPHELWEDRLLRLKQCGFNCIEIYTFWNFHEPREGQFDFSGDHDLDAFLKLVNKMGMYVIARVGPYYCAEWDNGGYPLWLRFKSGVRVREHNAEFEKYVGRFFDKLLPIVAGNQINHGGSVIMVQLENEHNEGWGTYMPNGYFHFLRDKALSLGLEVPYFFSGLHHSSSPAEDGKCDDPKRLNPWLSTEFWSVWYNNYNSSDSDAREYERRTMKILANGGNGYNYYMAHGGSNFGYTNNDEDAASYDYGAAVGQAGDLRPVYYSFKRVALFARSFENVLENSTDATESYKNTVSDTAIHITARKSPAGNIVFLENLSGSEVSMEIKNRKQTIPANARKINLKAGEIFPIVHHYKINDHVTLQWAPVKILGISKQGNTITMVVYGKPGLPAELYFSLSGKALITKGLSSLSYRSNQIRLQTIFSSDNKPLEFAFTVGMHKLRVLAMNEKLADRTWFIEKNQQQYIVTGPAYVSEINSNDRNISVITEKPWPQTQDFPCWVFSAQSAKQLRSTTSGSLSQKRLIALSSWQIKNARDEAMPDYDDKAWKKSSDPLQMGADGDLTADAWYRTNVDLDTAGTYSLQVEGSDRATGFIDGKIVSSGNIKDGEISLAMPAGKHLLAIFAAHDGRDKLAGFTGAMDSADSKGIFGKALLVTGGQSVQNLIDWKFLKATAASDVNSRPPSSDISGWEDYEIGKDAFNLKRGFGWFRTTLSNLPAGVSQILLKFKSVDENATVFINGNRLIKHDGWNRPFSLMIEHADTLERPILLSVFIENYSNEGGIDKPVRASYLAAARQLAGWSMRGGIGEPASLNGWKMMDKKSIHEGPCFFRSSFVVITKDSASHPVYRMVTEGLGHGSVWVNGHNLGRYPEKIPINGLYIPECWMKPGENTLIIYDEDGNLPSKVSVEAEVAASRDTQVFTDFQ